LTGKTATSHHLNRLRGLLKKSTQDENENDEHDEISHSLQQEQHCTSYRDLLQWGRSPQAPGFIRITPYWALRTLSVLGRDGRSWCQMMRWSIYRSFGRSGSRVLRTEGQNFVCTSSDCWYSQRMSIDAFSSSFLENSFYDRFARFISPAQYHAVPIQLSNINVHCSRTLKWPCFPSALARLCRETQQDHPWKLTIRLRLCKAVWGSDQHHSRCHTFLSAPKARYRHHSCTRTHRWDPIAFSRRAVSGSVCRRRCLASWALSDLPRLRMRPS
jgi:hypothetical protein